MAMVEKWLGFIGDYKNFCLGFFATQKVFKLQLYYNYSLKMRII